MKSDVPSTTLLVVIILGQSLANQQDEWVDSGHNSQDMGGDRASKYVCLHDKGWKKRYLEF